MKINKLIFAGAAAIIMAAPMAKADDAPKFMRSSIYTVLVNSDEQNKRLDEEAKMVDATGYAEALKAAKLKSLGEIPKNVFPTLTIPEQFNNHNLATRVVDFDKISAGISEADAKAAKPKGSKAGEIAKQVGAAALATVGNTSFIRFEKVDDYMHATLNKFMDTEKVAPMMVAKWYSYDAKGTPKFNHNLIAERGLENASAEELSKASANDEFKAQLSGQGFELINNTFVVATNLRFRNNKAVAAELKAVAEQAGAAAGAVAGKFGGMGAMAGGLAGKAAGAGVEALVNKLMKDQYSVTAVTNLYKLDWNDDIDHDLSEKVLYNDNATLDDLLNSGLCKLTYVGQTKARSGVKKDKTKTLDQLASSATARAIDKSLAKLQVENEVFRTIVPISKSENGMVYAKIGTKEGVAEGDEYEILEQGLDAKTNRYTYKKVGSAKVEKGQVWFNTSGAEELIANAEGAEQEQMKAAQALGYTCFKAGKKNDLSGYYLRLAKKKGKIED